MANNTAKYGFRPVRGWPGGGTNIPTPIEMAIADAYQATSDGAASNVGLSIGDPVLRVSTGTIGLATTTVDVAYIIVGFKPYWNGTFMTPTNYLPGATTGGGVDDRQSRALVVPVQACLWECDVDDNTTATTFDAYQAFIGENVDHTCVADLTNASRPKANPKLDISGHNTTDTLGWRIVAVSQSMENQDFSGTGVKLIVACNNIQTYVDDVGTTGVGV